MKANLSLFLGLITFILAVKSNPLSAQRDSIRKHHLLLFPVIAKSIETGWEFGGASSFTVPFRINFGVWEKIRQTQRWSPINFNNFIFMPI
jgi:hypothetical protein